MALHPSFRFGWRLFAIALAVIVLAGLVAQAQFPPVRPSTVRGTPTIPLAAQSTAVKDLAGNPVFILFPPNPSFPMSPGPSPLRPGTPVSQYCSAPLLLCRCAAARVTDERGRAKGFSG